MMGVQDLRSPRLYDIGRLCQLTLAAYAAAACVAPPSRFERTLTVACEWGGAGHRIVFVHRNRMAVSASRRDIWSRSRLKPWGCADVALTRRPRQEVE